MRKLFVSLLALSLAAPVTMAKKQKEMSGNPIIKGWYADPEGIFMGGKYWIFPTFSAPYKQQLFFDAFSSTDLVHWEKHERVLEQKNILHPNYKPVPNLLYNLICTVLEKYCHFY